MSTSPLFLFAGGGTGGHLFPGLAIAAALRRRDPAVRARFVGSERSLERDLVVEHGYDHRTLPSEPLTQLWRRPWSFVWRNWTAYRIASQWLREERPTAVIGLGGFASAPVVLAAQRAGIPVVLLEQNSIPGRATRWLSRWANVVCLAYPQSVSYFSSRVRTRLSGNPIREEIAALSRQPRVEKLPPTLLVLGGSQGAQPVNAAIVDMVRSHPDLLGGWRIVHQTGAAQCEAVRLAYQQVSQPAEVAPFFHDMMQRYQAATLVIARAGATTLAELACVGVPAILVPYPQSADNHQWYNAQTFADAGATVSCFQGETPRHLADDLARNLKELIADKERRDAMSEAMHSLAQPDATQRVIEVIDEICSVAVASRSVLPDSPGQAV